MMKAKFKKRLGQCAIGIWASGMSFVVACLMVNHWIALPHPVATDQTWATQLSQTRNTQAEPWTAFHFLYGDCPCSRRVLKHILERGPLDGYRERIVFIGVDTQVTEAAQRRGFEVDCVTPEVLKTRYGVEAAPLLTILNPAGTVCFAGGYTTHKQGPQIQDKRIMTALFAGESVEEIPLYGCAVSDTLKSLVDPLGLKK